LKLQSATEKILIDCLLITLAIFIPYSQVAQHRFIEFDDGLYTYQNNFIIQGLTWDSLVWAFTNTDAANWHPLTWISHLVDRELFGPHPGGYLLMNVAWHTLAACMCYMAFLRCTKKRFFALTVALIFALHPANVENVAWTSERKSLLDAFFWFLGIIAYIDFLETRKLKFYGVVLITHILGLLSKAMHVTFPCTLVLIHLLHTAANADGRTFSLRDYRLAMVSSLKSVWPLLLLSAYFSLVTASAQSIAMSSMEIHPLTGRIVNVLQSYEEYIQMFFSPGELSPFYPLFYKEQHLRNAILPGLFLGSITLLLVLLAAKRRPVPLLGWLWFLGTMVPVIGLVQVGAQSHADRYLYIPMIGLAFVFPELFDVFTTWKKTSLQRFQTGWLALTTLSLCLATYVQVGYWENGVTLFQHALKVSGDCVTSVNNLSCAYLRNERFADAIAFMDSKIRIAKNPYNIGKLYTLKGQAQLMLNKNEEAIESANRAISNGRGETATFWILANAHYQLKHTEQAKMALVAAKQMLGAPSAYQLNDMNIREGIRYLDIILQSSDSSSSANSAH